MTKKILYLIDNDNSFFKRFTKRLEIIKLQEEYEIKPYYPDTSFQDQLIENIIKDTKKEIIKLNVVAIFVDMVIIEEGISIDTSGIIIASKLKLLFPTIPVYNITGKFAADEYLDIFSEATMEPLDGVFSKNFLTDKKFDIYRLQKILQGKKSFVRPNENKRGKEIIKYDVGIITALYEDEFENLISEFKLAKLNYTENLYRGSLAIDGKHTINIIATHQYESGMVEAAIFTTSILNRFNPSYLVMTGVCGGKDDSNINFGDIVFATKVFTFHKGKLNPEVFQNESETCKINSSVTSQVRILKKTISRKIMDADISRSSRYELCPLKIHIEPMGCSDFVINDNGFFKLIAKLKDRKTVAIDMESYAVARACEITKNDSKKAFIIKSVMDKMKDKNNENKSFAAYTSVQFLKYFLTDILFKKNKQK